jgi:FAD/FMN-containing dehydrogenase
MDANEVSIVIQHATQFGLKIAVRGSGHSTDGQTQSENGIVLDTSLLHDIEFNATEGWIRIGAGLHWRDVLGFLSVFGFR